MKNKYYPIISLINGKKRDTLAEQFLDEIRAELGWELEAVDQIEDLKDEYTEKFSAVLVTAQNEVAINSIPMEYINNRTAK